MANLCHSGAQRGRRYYLNGPPARHFQPGDKIIVIGDGLVEPAELAELDHVVVFVDEKNRVTSVKRHTDLPVDRGIAVTVES